MWILFNLILIFTYFTFLIANTNSNNWNVEMSLLPSYNVIEIDFNKIMQLNKVAIMELINAMTSIGIVQIVNIPNYNINREKGLSSLSSCLLEEQNMNSNALLMRDGSKRFSTGAATMHGIPQELSNICAQSTSQELRATIDMAVRQVFRSIDSIRGNTNPVIFPYQSFDSLLSKGEHLEHMHSYMKIDESDKNFENEKITSELHIDAGLFIAMTAGKYSSSSECESKRGLFIELPRGILAHANVHDDALILMAGKGSSSWINFDSIGAYFRPVPHLLMAGICEVDSTRSWYGMMILPPNDAVIDVAKNVTYESYRKQYIQKYTFDSNVRKENNLIPAACEMYSYSEERKLQDCQGDQILCWEQCRNIPSGCAVSNAICIDTTDGSISDGGHCPTCVTSCKNISSNGYCIGGGTSMFMNGFTSIGLSDYGTTECVNFLFQSWTLDSRIKVATACFGVLVLGMLVQYLTYLRRILGRKNRTKEVVVMIVSLYSLQLILSYSLMLIAMTYSVELFLMVCFGLIFGYAAWNIEVTPLSTDQCCDENSLENGKLLL